MALLLLESYRGIATADSDDRFSFVNSSAKDSTIATATPRWNAGGYVANGIQAGEMLRRLNDFTWPLYIEFGMKRTSSQGGIQDILGFYGWQGPNAGVASAASFSYLVLNPDGTISVYKKNGANNFTCLATSTKAMKVDGWHFVQVKWWIDSRDDGANGSVDVYVNDQLWLSFTGIMVHNPSINSSVFDISEWTYIQFVGPNDVGNGSSGIQVLTDVVICDAVAPHDGFQGQVDIETLRPAGAGNYAEFTPSAGSNFQCVDETTPDGDTTYNASSTTGHRDSYTFTSLARATGDIKGLCINIVARTPEASIHQIRAFLRISGGDHDDTDMIVDQLYKHQRSTYFETSFGTPWDIALINAIEIGVGRN